MKSICEYLEEDRIKWNGLPYISAQKDGKFVTRTFGEVVDDVQSLARALISEGVCGNVMLYSKNSYEWAVSDLAVMGYVGVCVPIDSEWTAFDIMNTLSVIEINTVLYEKSRADVMVEVRKSHPEIRFICIEGASRITSNSISFHPLSDSSTRIWREYARALSQCLPNSSSL